MYSWSQWWEASLLVLGVSLLALPTHVSCCGKYGKVTFGFPFPSQEPIIARILCHPSWGSLHLPRWRSPSRCPPSSIPQRMIERPPPVIRSSGYSTLQSADQRFGSHQQPWKEIKLRSLTRKRLARLNQISTLLAEMEWTSNWKLSSISSARCR